MALKPFALPGTRAFTVMPDCGASHAIQSGHQLPLVSVAAARKASSVLGVFMPSGKVQCWYFMAEGGAHPVIGKLPGIHRDLRGSTVRLTAAPDKVHLFANGVSLLHR